MLDDKKPGKLLTSNWNGSIAIKITAVTIWAILLLTFCVIIPFVSSFEESTRKEFTWQQHQMENTLKKLYEGTPTEHEVYETIDSALKNTAIKYISLSNDNSYFSKGTSSPENFPLSSNITTYSGDYQLYVELPPLQRSINRQRVIIGSTIVGFSVLLSLFLFWLSKKIIHEPFDSIINLTKKISSGESQLRLKSDRSDEFGMVSRFLNQMLDTIEQKQLELSEKNRTLTEEIRNREEALAANTQKSNFLANMSHEIRTPLSSIIGYTERVRFDKAKDKNDEKRMLDIVLENGNHLLNLINDILDLSKVEANKLTIEKNEFSIIKVTEHVKKLLHERSLEKNIKFNIHYNLPIPEKIINDSIRTKQIILNLATNAIKFTQSGKVEIEVSYQLETDLLCITVIDSGIGMNEEEQVRLFKPFSQANTSISHQFGGTGLGLLISKRLAELMSGDITVQSVKGVGSRFICTLKAGYSEGNKLITSLSKNDIETFEYEKPVTDISLSGNLLLVEDTFEIQQLVQAYLEDYGIKIDVADNGEIGLEMALKNNYDLVLMDIQMPIMDGREAITKLRQANYTKPVFALTADALTEHTDEFIKLGFTKTLTKPIVINTLISSISEYIPLTEHSKNDPVTEQAAPTKPDTPAITSNNLDDIADNFRQKLPSMIAELKKSIRNDNIDEAYAILHRLKGVGSSLGFNNITDSSIEITRYLKQTEWDKVYDAIARLEIAYPVMPETL